uniref:HDAC_interact domain-containing protein n=1 Tax=Glossina austeni TaxID=7395 RepID=A0A1A9V7K4_GLOAU
MPRGQQKSQVRQFGSNSSGNVNDRQNSLQANDHNQEMDLASSTPLGDSYCALPRSTIPKKRSGREELCVAKCSTINEFLLPLGRVNTQPLSPAAKCNLRELERNRRTADERFALDVVNETNSATMRVLEG